MAKEETCRAKRHTAHARSLLNLLENADLEVIDPAAIHDVIGAAGRLLDEALAPVGEHPGQDPQRVQLMRGESAVPYLPIRQSDTDGS